MPPADSPADLPLDIDADTARRLVAEQFPAWAGLPVTPVAHGGWDNRTFRLGEELSIRLPSAEGYAAQVGREQRWLPRLAGQLPFLIPEPVAEGRPSATFPWPWSVYRWRPGEPATAERVGDDERLAADVGRFLAALQRIDASGGPPPGPSNGYRGGDLSRYDGEARAAIRVLDEHVDAGAVLAVWEQALASRWERPPVWVHGDVSSSNLLVVEGVLSAVIDFGSMAVGDPACDLVPAWTTFAGASRIRFAGALDVDAATWCRGRGWALWKALITWRDDRDGDAVGPSGSGAAERRFGWRRRAAEVVDDIVADAAAT